MSYKLEDLKIALEKNDKAKIVRIVRGIFNTLDDNQKEIAELKAKINKIVEAWEISKNEALGSLVMFGKNRRFSRLMERQE